MKRAVVYNIGCKVNQYECDTLTTGLKNMGYQTFDQLVNADIYIVNTCAVTAEAERKSRQVISRIRRINKDAYIMICGCASQKSKDFFVKKGIPFISGVSNKESLLQKIGTDFLSKDNLASEFEEPLNLPQGARTRAYVKIQDGCDNFCSYCIIPYLRGRSRSRSIENTVKEIESIAKETEEIVLTGINLSQYQVGEENLASLINAISHIDTRIRLGSFYVEGIDKELLNALFSLKKFCPHFHLSLQNGDDGVLADMNRHYTVADYTERVEMIREFDPMASITTDIIVGFPTETEEAFQNTLDFVERVGFSDIHIFPYSMRQGTAAEKYTPLDPQIIKDRRIRLENVREKLRKSYLTRTLNRPQEVLFEEEGSEGLSVGYSRYYVRIYAVAKQKIGNVEPTEYYKEGLKGEIIS